MIRICALNEELPSEESNSTGVERLSLVTKEAQESEAVSLYNDALRLLSQGNLTDAKSTFLKITEHPYIESTDDLDDLRGGREEGGGKLVDTRDLLKYSALKNLAELTQRDGSNLTDALDYYIKAVDVDSTDVSVWCEIGKLAKSLQKFSLARYAYECGLRCSNKNWPCFDNLITLLYSLGNYEACVQYIILALRIEPAYERGLVYLDRILTDCQNLNVKFRRHVEELDLCYSAADVNEDVAQMYIEEADKLRSERLSRCVLLDPQPVKPSQTLTSYTWKSLGECLIKIYDDVVEKRQNGSHRTTSLSHPVDLELMLVKNSFTSEQQENMECEDIGDLTRHDGDNNDNNTDVVALIDERSTPAGKSVESLNDLDKVRSENESIEVNEQQENAVHVEQANVDVEISEDIAGCKKVENTEGGQVRLDVDKYIEKDLKLKSVNANKDSKLNSEVEENIQERDYLETEIERVTNNENDDEKDCDNTDVIEENKTEKEQENENKNNNASDDKNDNSLSNKDVDMETESLLDLDNIIHKEVETRSDDNEKKNEKQDGGDSATTSSKERPTLLETGSGENSVASFVGRRSRYHGNHHEVVEKKEEEPIGYQNLFMKMLPDRLVWKSDREVNKTTGSQSVCNPLQSVTELRADKQEMSAAENVSQNFLSTENERVKELIEQHSMNSGVIHLIYSYLAELSKMALEKWPEGLVDVYLKLYERNKGHIPLPDLLRAGYVVETMAVLIDEISDLRLVYHVRALGLVICFTLCGRILRPFSCQSGKNDTNILYNYIASQNITSCCCYVYFSGDVQTQQIKDIGLINLVAVELALDFFEQRKYRAESESEKPGREVTERCDVSRTLLNFLLSLSSQYNILNSLTEEFCFRVHWSYFKYNTLHNDVGSAVNSLEEILRGLEDVATLDVEENKQMSYCIANLKMNSVISKDAVVEQMEILESHLSLDQLDTLLDEQKYEKIIELLASTFPPPLSSDSASKSMTSLSGRSFKVAPSERRYQLIMLGEVLVEINDKQRGIVYGEYCLNEALQFYVSVVSIAGKKKWSGVIVRLLSLIYKFLDGGLAVLRNISEKNLCRFARNLIQIIDIILNTDEEAVEMQIDSILQWILLYKIIKFVEIEEKCKKGADKAVTQDSASSKSSDEDDDNDDNDDDDDDDDDETLPASVALLIAAHDNMGMRSWCLREEGKLVLFVVENLMSELYELTPHKINKLLYHNSDHSDTVSSVKGLTLTGSQKSPAEADNANSVKPADSATDILTVTDRSNEAMADNMKDADSAFRGIDTVNPSEADKTDTADKMEVDNAVSPLTVAQSVSSVVRNTDTPRPEDTVSADVTDTSDSLTDNDKPADYNLASSTASHVDSAKSTENPSSIEHSNDKITNTARPTAAHCHSDSVIISDTTDRQTDSVSSPHIINIVDTDTCQPVIMESESADELSAESEFRLVSYHSEIEIALEQCFYCLYGYPKKSRSKRLEDHNVTPIDLTWERCGAMFEYFKPQELPEYDSFKTSAISTELEKLLRQMLYLAPRSEELPTKRKQLISFIKDSAEAPEYFNQTSTDKNLSKMKEIYYLLADFYLKNQDPEKAMQYYMDDLCYNPHRFDSWAGLALAHAAELEYKLSDLDVRLDVSLQSLSRSALCCFERALTLDRSNTKLWLEYGSNAYIVHSHASRQIRQAKSLGLSKELLEESKQLRLSMLRLAQSCFTMASGVGGEVGGGGSGEEWLQHYMLGKIAEKLEPLSPSVYLDHYIKAAQYLHEEKAKYPKKIAYYNPPHLSVEALEMYYRLHTAIVKFLLKYDNTGPCTDMLSSYINQAAEGALVNFHERDHKKTERKHLNIGQESEVLSVSPADTPVREAVFTRSKSHLTSTAHPSTTPLSSASQDLPTASDLLPIQLDMTVESGSVRNELSSCSDIVMDVTGSEASIAEKVVESGAGDVVTSDVNIENKSCSDKCDDSAVPGQCEDLSIAESTGNIKAKPEAINSVQVKISEIQESQPFIPSFIEIMDEKSLKQNDKFDLEAPQHSSLSNIETAGNEAVTESVTCSSNEKPSINAENDVAPTGECERKRHVGETDIKFAESDMKTEDCGIVTDSVDELPVKRIKLDVASDTLENVKEEESVSSVDVLRVKNEEVREVKNEDQECSITSPMLIEDSSDDDLCNVDQEIMINMESGCMRVVLNTRSESLARTTCNTENSATITLNRDTESKTVSSGLESGAVDVGSVKSSADVATGVRDLDFVIADVECGDNKQNVQVNDVKDLANKPASVENRASIRGEKMVNVSQESLNKEVLDVEENSSVQASVLAVERKSTVGTSDSGKEIPQQKKNISVEEEEVVIVEMTDDERCEMILEKCMKALRLCLARFPQHFKSLYHLAYIYMKSPYHKNLSHSRDLLLGCTVSNPIPTHMPCPGLFNERKPSNFFQGVWRIPMQDIDRTGSFPAHLSRSLDLLFSVLVQLSDSRNLFRIHCQLNKVPEAGKKYLIESERKRLAEAAFRFCLEVITEEVKRFKSQRIIDSDTKLNFAEPEQKNSAVMDTVLKSKEAVDLSENKKEGVTSSAEPGTRTDLERSTMIQSEISSTSQIDKSLNELQSVNILPEVSAVNSVSLSDVSTASASVSMVSISSSSSVDVHAVSSETMEDNVLSQMNQGESLGQNVSSMKEVIDGEKVEEIKTESIDERVYGINDVTDADVVIIEDKPMGTDIVSADTMSTGTVVDKTKNVTDTSAAEGITSSMSVTEADVTILSSNKHKEAMLSADEVTSIETTAAASRPIDISESCETTSVVSKIALPYGSDNDVVIISPVKISHSAELAKYFSNNSTSQMSSASNVKDSASVRSDSLRCTSSQSITKPVVHSSAQSIANTTLQPDWPFLQHVHQLCLHARRQNTLVKEFDWLLVESYCILHGTSRAVRVEEVLRYCSQRLNSGGSLTPSNPHRLPPTPPRLSYSAGSLNLAVRLAQSNSQRFGSPNQKQINYPRPGQQYPRSWQLYPRPGLRPGQPARPVQLAGTTPSNSCQPLRKFPSTAPGVTPNRGAILHKSVAVPVNRTPLMRCNVAGPRQSSSMGSASALKRSHDQMVRRPVPPGGGLASGEKRFKMKEIIGNKVSPSKSFVKSQGTSAESKGRNIFEVISIDDDDDDDVQKPQQSGHQQQSQQRQIQKSNQQGQQQQQKIGKEQVGSDKVNENSDIDIEGESEGERGKKRVTERSNEKHSAEIMLDTDADDNNDNNDDKSQESSELSQEKNDSGSDYHVEDDDDDDDDDEDVRRLIKRRRKSSSTATTKSAPPQVQVTKSTPQQVQPPKSTSQQVQATNSAPPQVQATKSAPPQVLATKSAPPQVQATKSAPPQVQATKSAPPQVQATKSAPPQVQATKSTPIQAQPEKVHVSSTLDDEAELLANLLYLSKHTSAAAAAAAANIFQQKSANQTQAANAQQKPAASQQRATTNQQNSQSKQAAVRQSIATNISPSYSQQRLAANKQLKDLQSTYRVQQQQQLVNRMKTSQKSSATKQVLHLNSPEITRMLNQRKALQQQGSHLPAATQQRPQLPAASQQRPQQAAASQQLQKQVLVSQQIRQPVESASRQVYTVSKGQSTSSLSLKQRETSSGSQKHQPGQAARQMTQAPVQQKPQQKILENVKQQEPRRRSCSPQSSAEGSASKSINPGSVRVIGTGTQYTTSVRPAAAQPSRHVTQPAVDEVVILSSSDSE